MDNTIVRIGENIKILREQSNFTQSHIAKYLKVDQSLVSKIEKGERNITSDMLDKLASLFGVQVESFNCDSLPTNRIAFSLRASKISEDDLETVSAINRIALNSNFMTHLLGGDEFNG